MAKSKVKKPNVVATKRNKKKAKAGIGIMLEDIAILMRQDFLSYTIANMVRSIPDYRDGLKPSHRRALFTLFQLGSGLKKSARIVGEMLGKYHPHGDQAAYGTIVRMAQDFNNNVCLVKPQGNFGSIDGDSAASMRYCCTGDTMIDSSIGKKSILEIYQMFDKDKNKSTVELTHGSLSVKSFDGTMNNVSAIFNSGTHPVKELVLQNGMKIKGSYNHPVLTLGSDLTYKWVNLEDIKDDAEVMIYVDSDEFNNIPDFKYFSKIMYHYIINRHIRGSIIGFMCEFNSMYRAVPVTSIKDVEPENVYSFRVDSKCHSYISNGLISHNTEAEMSEFAKDVYFNDEFVAVEMIDNFDGTLKEPAVLCPKIPVALVNGISGIATGVAMDVPPHNINEVCALTSLWLQYKVQNKIPKSYDVFLDCIKGPDFPTGGVVYDTSGVGIKNGISTGSGQVWILPLFHIEKYDYGRDAIIIDEMAYKIVKAEMIEKIANLVRDGKLEGISDLKDESDGRNGIRVVIVLKKGVDHKKIVDYLVTMKVIASQRKYSMTFVRNNRPVKMGVIDIVDYHTQHRKEVLMKFFNMVIQKAESDLHLQEGLLIFIKNFKEVSTIIINGKDENDVIAKLMKKYKLTKSQVNFILDTKMRKNIKHGEQVKAKISQLKQRIKDFSAHLKNPYKYMLAEVEEIAKKYKNKRRTKILISKSIRLNEPKKKTKK